MSLFRHLCNLWDSPGSGLGLVRRHSFVCRLHSPHCGQFADVQTEAQREKRGCPWSPSKSRKKVQSSRKADLAVPREKGQSSGLSLCPTQPTTDLALVPTRVASGCRLRSHTDDQKQEVSTYYAFPTMWLPETLEDTAFMALTVSSSSKQEQQTPGLSP